MMPVKKFRSIEEAEASCWLDKNDPNLLRIISALWHFSHVTAPQHWTPGVYRFDPLGNPGVPQLQRY